MIKHLFVFYYLLFAAGIIAQERNVNDVLDYTLLCRGLTRQDITIPIEFFSAAEKSPTNDSKLILPLVKDIMVNPLRSMTWLDSVSEWVDYSIPDYDCFRMLDSNFYPLPIIYIIEGRFSQAIDEVISRIKNKRNFQAKLLSKLSIEERSFLVKNLLSIFEEEDSDDSNFDIFKFNNSRDSSIITSKTTLDILSKLDIKETYKYFVDDLRYYNRLAWKLKKNNVEYFEDKKYFNDTLTDFFDYKNLKRIENEYVQGDFYYYSDKDGIRIAIGGPGKNIYTGKFDFIIDLGGDDVYNIDKPKGEFEGGFSCIIDMSGNDYYSTSSDFALAGGLFSSSFIFDKEGDDFYESKGSGNLGAAIGGLGLLYDEKGNDTYKGISFSIGAGCFGVGLLVDREGNDFYIANSYSQGFGMTEGVGAIVDNKGNDSYLVDSRSLDIGRYNDHYVSMCQGYGLGLRPYYAGGIGLIIEGEGNDIYNTDIFGQGGAYWYSLGAIVDKSGHDKYNGYQYSQGAGIHLAVGLLKDYDGWDFYQSNGVSQGCGHDFGFGMLWDVKGNDNFSAYSLSQGAGNADGIGILIDESGVDGYLNKYPGLTRGYGNPRREYGSIGVFLDMSGTDYYSQPGYDSTIINSSQWGIVNDFYLADLLSQVSGDNFKVAVDSATNIDPTGLKKGSPFSDSHNGPYSTEQYFKMAMTIEPRFSLWQEYGFRELIEDSLNSANYVLTQLGTDDHRVTQVLRVLSQKLQKPVADAILGKLNDYIAGKTEMTQPEVSFACYIFGETGNPDGKDILLQLTFDVNYRVRSSAINALGKIKYDRQDAEFIKNVSLRLSSLAGEKSERKLYSKDIAFALGNYLSNESFDALMGMLNDPYYGARFVAAGNLSKYDQLRFLTATDNSFPAFPQEVIPLIAFMQSLGELSETDFMIFESFIKLSPVFESDAVVINLCEALKLRKSRSINQGFTNWCEIEINTMQAKVKSVIR